MPRIVLACAVCCWAALLSVLGLWKYAIFRSDVDAGLFTQVLLSFGSGFSSTVEGGVNHLLVHCSPILIALVPVVRITGDARSLIVAQAVLNALVAIPVYAIARRRTGAWASCAIACAALCYPVLWASAFTDFHENAFVPVLAATLAWAIDARRTWPAVLASLALCCTKEDEFVILALAAPLVMLAYRGDARRRTIALAMLGLGVACAALYFGAVLAVVRVPFGYWSLHFYNWHQTASSPLGFTPLLSPDRPLYLLWAFVPLAFIPLRSRLALLTIPGFIEVLASHETIVLSLGTHYTAVWLGFMLAAFGAGAARLPRPALALAPLLSAIVLFAHDPMARWYFLYRLPNAHDRLLDATLHALPRAVTVGADDQIFAHLSDRRLASLMLGGQQYYVFDRTQYSVQWATIDRPRVAAALRAGTYRVRSDKDGIVVLERAR